MCFFWAVYIKTLKKKNKMIWNTFQEKNSFFFEISLVFDFYQKLSFEKLYFKPKIVEVSFNFCSKKFLEKKKLFFLHIF